MTVPESQTASDVQADKPDRTLLGRLARSGGLIPVLVLLGGFYIYPIARMVYLSLGGRDLTASSYYEFFQTGAFVRVLWFTVLMSLVVTCSCLIIGYPVAYALASSGPFVRNALFIFILVPWLMPELVRNFAWLVILQTNGVLSSVQKAVGLGAQPVITTGTRAAMLIGMVTVQLPLSVLPLYAVMRRIDLSLLPTASSLGARPLQTIRTVLIPLSMPGVATSFILTFLTTLGFYVTPLMLGGGSHIFMANLIDIEVSRIVNWQYGSAMSVILVIAGFGVMALGNRLVGLRWLIER